MNNYLYILTDSNRNCLHVGMTDNLQQTAKTYQKLNRLFFDARLGTPRLVYHETLPDHETALRRFNEVSRYTRMQKERLIRRQNPNWLDLSRLFPKPGIDLPDASLFHTSLVINSLSI